MEIKPNNIYMCEATYFEWWVNKIEIWVMKIYKLKHHLNHLLFDKKNIIGTMT